MVTKSFAKTNNIELLFILEVSHLGSVGGEY